jgi:hypothetical protein
MGLFDKIFGGARTLPELDPTSPAARRLETYRRPLETVAEKTKDRLEVVLGEDKAFVFVGKPPKQFGLAWTDGVDVKNLKEQLGRLGPNEVEGLVGALAEAYRRSETEERRVATVADRRCVVNLSSRLGSEVEEILARA